jgi:hypothetical protein
MAYDIEGEVKDSSDNPIKGVSISDGVQKYTTLSDGSYALKTDATKLTFSKDGYNVNTFDLSKYKNPSSVNVDITLTTKSASITNPSSTDVQSKEKGGFFTWSTKTTSQKAFFVIGGLVVLVGGYFIYKKFKK